MTYNPTLSKEQLSKIMPRIGARKLPQMLSHLNDAMRDYGINTKYRQAAFLAQLAHESGEFMYFEELASGKAYEGRKDLGNTSPGDGVRYKGRGPIQITGKYNYKKYGDKLGVDLIRHPKLAATKELGFKLAAEYWVDHNLNELADARAFKKITKKINGGYRGYSDRKRYYARALEVLENG